MLIIYGISIEWCVLYKCNADRWSCTCFMNGVWGTGTCSIQKIYAPSSSLLQGKHTSTLFPYSTLCPRFTMFSFLSKCSMCTQLRFCVRVATRLLVVTGKQKHTSFYILKNERVYAHSHNPFTKTDHN
jgi:hypothetical protein